MKYFTFRRESNYFTDILTDINLRKLIEVRLEWLHHLVIGLSSDSEKNASYITLKYGDEMVREVCHDWSPIIGVDYASKTINI